MSEWREVAIGELCVRTTSGGTPSRKKPEYFSDPQGGVPWVRSQELVDRRISSVGEHITEVGLRKSSAKLVPPGSVLIAMYGATVGQLGYLDIQAATNQAVCALITDPNATSSRFLYYALMDARSDLIARAHGAAQQNLSQETIRKFCLQVPSLPVQREIAAILGGIDDLIENNRRRVDLLEQMAQAIYREWFVHFRYPGNQDVALVHSPLGVIPKGWGVCRLDEACKFLDGKPIKKEERSGGDVVVYGANGPIGHTALPAMFGACTVMGKIGSCGALHRAVKPCWVTNNAFAVEPAVWRSPYLVWLGLTQIDFNPLIGGAANPYLPKKNFGHLPVIQPSQVLIDRFHLVAKPIFDTTELLEEELTALIAMRDLLLPKLMTGEIDVTELDLDAVVGSVA